MWDFIVNLLIDIFVIVIALIMFLGTIAVCWAGVVTIFRPFYPKFFDHFAEMDLSEGPSTFSGD